MIDNRRLLIAVAFACLVLAGCGKNAAEGNKAAGEVFEGTISDAMIATDQTRSQPPLAPHNAKATDGKVDKAKGNATGETETAAEPGTSPTPEEPPAPKPTASEPAE